MMSLDRDLTKLNEDQMARINGGGEQCTPGSTETIVYDNDAIIEWTCVTKTKKNGTTKNKLQATKQYAEGESPLDNTEEPK
ncbi:MAG TPA: hypothetical protein PKY77_26470 [Phycisphaerae bacterium]|nr:hypothetical protein [Phycisphaerae bacterium]HSA30078.1 hypothetical protein [Phycisphaerae bacterium]